jgi:hypothetical protein
MKILLPLLEGLGISLAISFADQGFHLTGWVIGVATVSLAYADGKYGWSA